VLSAIANILSNETALPARSNCPGLAQKDAEFRKFHPVSQRSARQQAQIPIESLLPSLE
jgi:hypothetical protein